MPNQLPTILFAGPSLSPKARQLAVEREIVLRPPVQRGDLPALWQEGFRGRVIIVDGVYHQVLSVGHAEIRRAMERGIELFGVSSMGAIRAYEMRHLGMVGFGKVYERFFQMEDFQDDELALLHESEPPYRPLSEPLVHLRECLERLQQLQRLSPEAAGALLTHFKRQYFGRRTLPAIEAKWKEITGRPMRHWVDDFERFRVKHRDLEQFLEREIWLTSADALDNHAAP